MRAIQCREWGGPEKLALVSTELRLPGPNELKLRVRAAGVNFPDVLIIQQKYQLKPELPFTPGCEVAGDVIAVGPGVADFRTGQRVMAYCSLGGFAEEAIVPAASCFAMPEGLGYEVASAVLLAYGTSWHALRDRARLREGETLLVLGASGGVGLAAVEIGVALGARVIAGASSDRKLSICRERGAAALLNYRSDNLREAIARLTERHGPDVIYDPVGGALAEPAFRSIAWRGRYLVVGFAAGSIPSIALNLPLLKGAAIVGVYWGEHMKRERQGYRQETEELLGLIGSERLKPLVSRSYPLEQAPQALADMAAAKVVGKIVVVP
jgi:NADPH2:quinone reductase